jgi:hypothetical protein
MPSEESERSCIVFVSGIDFAFFHDFSI